MIGGIPMGVTNHFEGRTDGVSSSDMFGGTAVSDPESSLRFLEHELRWVFIELRPR